MGGINFGWVAVWPDWLSLKL